MVTTDKDSQVNLYLSFGVVTAIFCFLFPPFRLALTPPPQSAALDFPSQMARTMNGGASQWHLPNGFEKNR
jgi:hypothetical protein